MIRQKIKQNIEIINLINPFSRHKCIYTTALEAIDNIEKDVNNGQGLGVTK